MKVRPFRKRNMQHADLRNNRIWRLCRMFVIATGIRLGLKNLRFVHLAGFIKKWTQYALSNASYLDASVSKRVFVRNLHAKMNLICMKLGSPKTGIDTGAKGHSETITLKQIYRAWPLILVPLFVVCCLIEMSLLTSYQHRHNRKDFLVVSIRSHVAKSDTRQAR